MRKGPILANLEGSQFANPGGSLFLQIRKGPLFANPEGSPVCQSGRVLFCQFGRAPIRKSPNFCQSGRVPFLQSGRIPIRKGPILANPEVSQFAYPVGSHFCQSGRVITFVSPDGSQKYPFLKLMHITHVIPGILKRT